MITMKLILLIGHVIGVALGVGGATMSDVLFLTSISDRRIDRSELKLLRIASKVVVTGLLVLAVTGVAFVVTGSPLSPRFWAKMTIVAIASINGYVMHQFMFPLFERCQRERIHLLSAEITQHAPFIVTAGALSALSWYSALALGMWRTLTLSYLEIMGVYFLLLFGAVVVANVAVQWFLRDPDQAIARVDALTKQVSQRLTL